MDLLAFNLLSIGVFLVVILVLVIVLLVAKKYLSPSGQVTLTVNGDTKLTVNQGGSVMATLNENGIYLPSACGGKASCGQCKLQILKGGGEILDSEKPHFTRKEIKDHWRLGCQAKIKGDMEVKVPESVLGVKEWECTVIGNRNVATFIKEYKVALPPGEHMDFEPGSYAQIRIPAFELDYDKDFDKSLIGDTYLPAWEKFGLFGLKCVNPEPTIRAYSMANYPDEGDIITLNVRIATPPFKPKDQGTGFMDVNPGIASSYIFSLKPGDKVIMSGPYGEFRPQYVVVVPVWLLSVHRSCTCSKVMVLLQRIVSVQCTISMVHVLLRKSHSSTTSSSLRRTSLTSTSILPSTVQIQRQMQQHETPEDCEYYLCGPPMMAKTVLDLLHSLGVEDNMIRFDNFGG